MKNHKRQINKNNAADENDHFNDHVIWDKE